jgi:Gas vesicle synthesis protein GvpL/GvpF
VAVETPIADGAEASASTALYLYGVTWADAARPQQNAGVHGASIEPILYRELAGLTSAVESTKVRAKRRDLLSHAEVLSSALEHGTVLPLRFGVVFDNAAALVDEFLRPRYDELVKLLRSFEGRVELSVKAFYVEEAILAEIVRANPLIARLREATRAASDNSTYPLRVELGERVGAELQERTLHDRQALLDRLSRLAVDVQVDQQPIEHQVLGASFLVERDRVAAFDDAMNKLARQQAERMHFKYLGPLAPHSFVGLTAEAR